ncbi:Rgg/GadR/MutR family transcriptional regulator [Streptococcus iniae]|uniref:MutR family transcriptional regulator n=1 Tax=Streptococcus iniae TaxID=1346 RepID=A0A3L8GR05_STRIN|nr:Rgg/GadR/MutR family transcriptional regulator [Streptococcus iniae]AGM98057.1 DNA-binding protein [Streptococcus iniae SF1]AHY15128.1 MutR family transcriptional regulator [Streptococcus iniae]AHY16998.1 MutR family transcriptional regulator [Streptococcus iniae]AJG25315.1 MutR family transcriptional regulator [Streptococcus iniae]APD31189.1 MutR family transcriptional regulator [Streptococcus iniae]
MERYQKLGSTFRLLRKNRHISLKQVATDEVSVSQLSRFERGESALSVEKFFIALENINVEMKEFMDTWNNYQKTEQIRFMSSLIDLEYKRDIQGFRQLLVSEQEKFKEQSSNYRHYLNIILLQGFICKCDSSIPFPKKYVEEISDYLFSTEQWEIYEIILIGNLYLFIDVPLLHKMGQEIINRRDFYQEIGTHNDLVIMTLLNIWESCLHRDSIVIARYYQAEIEKLLHNETKVYERTIYLFLLGLQEYKEKYALSGIEKMNQAIQIFKWLGCTNLANNYTNDLKKCLH